jgi:hypothetical protein
LMCLFYLGIEPRTLHRWYYGKRSGAGRTLGGEPL